MTDDRYAHWKAALAGKAPPIFADSPHCGIYKARRHKNGPYAPVVMWYGDDGAMKALYGTEHVDPLRVWTYCADKPVSTDDYRHWKDNGRFPGEIASIGDNSGDVSLADEIEDAAAQAKEFAGKQIADKVAADTCANMRARLLELAKTADKERETKVRPHLDAQKAVNAEYRPLVDKATEAANLLRNELTGWMRKEEARVRAEQEAKRKAEEASRTLEMPPLPPPEPPKIQAGGQAGRKAGLRTVVKFEIADYDVLCAEFCEHEQVRELILKLATQRAKTGVVVPGLMRTETQEAA